MGDGKVALPRFIEDLGCKVNWSWISPSFFVLLGACLVAGGTFWSAQRQSALNKKIILLQGNSIDLLKGGDRVLFTPSAFTSGADGKYTIGSQVAGSLPIYDVYLIIRSHVDAPMTTEIERSSAMTYIMHPDHVELGNLPVGIKDTPLRLSPGYYQIDIRARGARLVEMLRFSPNPGSNPDFHMSYVLGVSGGEILEKYTSPGAPSTY